MQSIGAHAASAAPRSRAFASNNPHHHRSYMARILPCSRAPQPSVRTTHLREPLHTAAPCLVACVESLDMPPCFGLFLIPPLQRAYCVPATASRHTCATGLPATWTSTRTEAAPCPAATASATSASCGPSPSPCPATSSVTVTQGGDGRVTATWTLSVTANATGSGRASREGSGRSRPCRRLRPRRSGPAREAVAAGRRRAQSGRPGSASGCWWGAGRGWGQGGSIVMF